MRPVRHVPPRSRETAKPIAAAPPSKNRPLWNTATTVEPAAAACGSTALACCAPPSAVRSPATRTTPVPGRTAASAEAVRARKPSAAPSKLIIFGLDFLSTHLQQGRTYGKDYRHRSRHDQQLH